MSYSVLPLRDVVIYPGVVTPLFVGREKSISAINLAAKESMKIVLITQKSADIERPEPDDIYENGTLANIIQIMHLPDGTIKLLVESYKRVLIESINDDLTECEIGILDDILPTNQKEVDSLRQSLLKSFRKYLASQNKHPKELFDSVESIDDVSLLIDAISSHVNLKLELKIELLAEIDVLARATQLLSILETELDILELEKSIRNRVKKQMDKNQREYYLNEQAKAIQKELEDLDGNKNELGLLEESIRKAKMPKVVETRCLTEVEKLRKMPTMSSEATVIRNYLDVLIAYPWKVSSKNSLDIMAVQKMLNDSHYGLDDVKKRIVEYVAVQNRLKKPGGTILCLVGPPGVGKTSIGKSIAEATGKEYIRMSLGGVRDEAEIRGHRRTYIGAMPGRIVQNISKSKVNNPLFLLDEIDKMGMDHRGDPASAMLEVLDPEQNTKFNDHYMEVDLDLSQVMFVATANTLDIPDALLDRLEVIRIPGYTESEKLNIGLQYLIPQNLEKAGLDASEIEFTDVALRLIIENYTRDAGVRGLDKQIAKICRKVVMDISLNQYQKVVIDGDNIEYYLGVKKYQHDGIVDCASIGQINGLAWTSVGGEILKIEVVISPGKGRVVETGKLGDVMKESIDAAMTVVKSYANRLGVSYNFFQEHDIHIHLPEGAVPKDGPSAGGALATAILSAVMHEAIPGDIAMTGEITLQGNILAIGGLKEKLFAASREKIKTVFIPKMNEKDLVDIPDEIKNSLEINLIEKIEDVFSSVFSNRLKIKDKKEEKNPFYCNYLNVTGENTKKH